MHHLFKSIGLLITHSSNGTNAKRFTHGRSVIIVMIIQSRVLPTLQQIIISIHFTHNITSCHSRKSHLHWNKFLMWKLSAIIFISIYFIAIVLLSIKCAWHISNELIQILFKSLCCWQVWFSSLQKIGHASIDIRPKLFSNQML